MSNTAWGPKQAFFPSYGIKESAEPPLPLQPPAGCAPPAHAHLPRPALASPLSASCKLRLNQARQLTHGHLSVWQPLPLGNQEHAPWMLPPIIWCRTCCRRRWLLAAAWLQLGAAPAATPPLHCRRQRGQLRSLLPRRAALWQGL